MQVPEMTEVEVASGIGRELGFVNKFPDDSEMQKGL